MDTSETGLEKIIVDWLRDKNGYEQATPHDYNKTFALVESWVERFVTATQPDKVKESMCFASPSERLKFLLACLGKLASGESWMFFAKDISLMAIPSTSITRFLRNSIRVPRLLTSKISSVSSDR